MIKTPVPRPHSYVNEIYVTRKRPLKVYAKRMQKLIEADIPSVILHATGMAIPQAMDLYNLYSKHFASSAIESSTVSVLDKFEQKEDKIRLLPALHIQLNKH